MKSFVLRLLSLMLVSAMFLSACSLAEDITPPPGAEQMAVVQEQPLATNGPVFPLVPPSPADGQAIFAEKCAPCHGPAGLGDGPQEAQLPNPVAAIGSADFARQATPADWYTQVTKGNIEKFMPPFASLSDRERWDTVAYAFSLSMPPEVIAQGEQLFQANCAQCHGEGGTGGSATIDFTDQAAMAEASQASLFQIISDGVAPSMPGFAQQLSEDERWALAAYLRSLTFAPSSQPVAEQPATTPAVTAEPGAAVTELPTAAISETVGTITGNVTNASGGVIPLDLNLTLHGFDNMQMAITQTATTNADGSFVFNNVAMPPGRAFIIITEYGNTVYNTDVAQVEEGQNSLNLPLEIYDTTTDTSVLKADRLHMFFEFVDSKTVRVVELYVITNPTNKTLVAAEKGQPVVRFTLPKGAENLEFQDGVLGQRYVKTEDGFGDTAAVPPGQGQYEVLYAYTMPYDRKLELDEPVNLPVDAVVILVPEGGVKIKSDMLTDSGTQDVQGAKYRLLKGASLQPGDSLHMSITGQPTAGQPTLPTGSSTNLMIGLGVFGLALVLAGVWLWRRTRANTEEVEPEEDAPASEPEPTEESVETLMDAIIALDDLYQAGQLPEEAYLKRRADLKARLQERMGNS
jgi:mono/diheme cytochrome c family protein